MFQQENKDFSDKHSELFSIDAMKQLEKDFQFFDPQLGKTLLPQAKDSPFALFNQNIFADIKPEDMAKEVMRQNVARRTEMNILKDSDPYTKSKKGKEMKKNCG
jgi:hypothetical protein